MKVEIITITKIEGRRVFYSGSEHFDGGDIEFFPSTPEVGKKFVLKNDFAHPSVLEEYE